MGKIQSNHGDLLLGFTVLYLVFTAFAGVPTSELGGATECRFFKDCASCTNHTWGCENPPGYTGPWPWGTEEAGHECYFSCGWCAETNECRQITHQNHAETCIAPMECTCSDFSEPTYEWQRYGHTDCPNFYEFAKTSETCTDGDCCELEMDSVECARTVYGNATGNITCAWCPDNKADINSAGKCRVADYYGTPVESFGGFNSDICDCPSLRSYTMTDDIFVPTCSQQDFNREPADKSGEFNEGINNMNGNFDCEADDGACKDVINDILLSNTAKYIYIGLAGLAVLGVIGLYFLYLFAVLKEKQHAHGLVEKDIDKMKKKKEEYDDDEFDDEEEEIKAALSFASSSQISGIQAKSLDSQWGLADFKENDSEGSFRQDQEAGP